MVSTGIVIKKATEKHLKDIEKLSYEVFEYHYHLVPNFFAKKDENSNSHYYYDLKEKLKDKEKAIFLVAIKDRAVVGYLSALVLDKPWRKINPLCSLDEIGVLESYRNLGIGKALFNALKKECKKRKLGDITLNVYANNTRAINFYKKLGCHITSMRMDIEIK